MNKKKDIRINSGVEYLEFLDTFKSTGSFLPAWNFRGQSNYNWSLQPSFARICTDYNLTDQDDACRLELSLLRTFKMHSQLFAEFDTKLDFKKSVVPTWSQMQHFGTPTRLLDWSDSPLVALYFAVSSLSKNDAAVYMINNEVIGHFSDNQKGKIDLDNLLDPPYKGKIQTIIPMTSSHRSMKQQGVFSVSDDPLADHWDLIQGLELPPNSYYKVRIPFIKKLGILQWLRGNNIKADVLFPDAVGFAKNLEEILYIRLNERNWKNK